ncbi:ribonuclease, partial [Streptomyces fradiae]
GNGSNPLMGRVSMLLEWHEQDPPDAFEKNRNEVIYADFQHNRNPFIDHPEWAGEIWG